MYNIKNAAYSIFKWNNINIIANSITKEHIIRAI